MLSISSSKRSAAIPRRCKRSCNWPPASTTALISKCARACGRPLLQLVNALWPAIQDGILSNLGKGHRFLHLIGPELVGAEQREGNHLLIGRMLLEDFSDEELEEHLFVVVQQLNIGRGKLGGDDEALRLAELNLRAGKRTKNSMAYGPAAKLFQAGRQLLPASASGPWRTLALCCPSRVRASKSPRRSSGNSPNTASICVAAPS